MATRTPALPLAADFTQPIDDLIRAVVPDPGHFLSAPNAALGGQTPRHLLAQPDGEQAVRQLVLAYKYGVFA